MLLTGVRRFFLQVIIFFSENAPIFNECLDSSNKKLYSYCPLKGYFHLVLVYYIYFCKSYHNYRLMLIVIHVKTIACSNNKNECYNSPEVYLGVASLKICNFSIKRFKTNRAGFQNCLDISFSLTTYIITILNSTGSAKHTCVSNC